MGESMSPGRDDFRKQCVRNVATLWTLEHAYEIQYLLAVCNALHRMIGEVLDPNSWWGPLIHDSFSVFKCAEEGKGFGLFAKKDMSVPTDCPEWRTGVRDRAESYRSCLFRELWDEPLSALTEANQEELHAWVGHMAVHLGEDLGQDVRLDARGQVPDEDVNPKRVWLTFDELIPKVFEILIQEVERATRDPTGENKFYGIAWEMQLALEDAYKQPGHTTEMQSVRYLLGFLQYQASHCAHLQNAITMDGHRRAFQSAICIHMASHPPPRLPLGCMPITIEPTGHYAGALHPDLIEQNVYEFPVYVMNSDGEPTIRYGVQTQEPFVSVCRFEYTGSVDRRTWGELARCSILSVLDCPEQCSVQDPLTWLLADFTL